MTDSTDAGIWAEGSPLTRQLAGYQLRSGQVRMAAWITEALADRQARVIEAGTGIGKTFAYLVPVLTGTDRVLISTATLALQDQVMGKDLPFLQRVWGSGATLPCSRGGGAICAAIDFLWPSRISGSTAEAHWAVSGLGPNRPSPGICPNAPACPPIQN